METKKSSKSIRILPTNDEATTDLEIKNVKSKLRSIVIKLSKDREQTTEIVSEIKQTELNILSINSQMIQSKTIIGATNTTCKTVGKKLFQLLNETKTLLKTLHETDRDLNKEKAAKELLKKEENMKLVQMSSRLRLVQESLGPKIEILLSSRLIIQNYVPIPLEVTIQYETMVCVFRVQKGVQMYDILHDAANFFGVHPKRVMFQDRSNALYCLNMDVAKECCQGQLAKISAILSKNLWYMDNHTDANETLDDVVGPIGDKILYMCEKPERFLGLEIKLDSVENDISNYIRARRRKGMKIDTQGRINNESLGTSKLQSEIISEGVNKNCENDKNSESETEVLEETVQQRIRRSKSQMRKECCFYFLFVAMYAISIIFSINVYASFVTQSGISTIILDQVSNHQLLWTFNDIQNPGDIWDFLNFQFVPLLTPFNNSLYFQNPTTHLIVGGVQFRTLRIKPNVCSVISQYNTFPYSPITCYTSYIDENSLAKSPYGPKKQWYYYKSDSIFYISEGQISMYPGSGYKIDLNTDNIFTYPDFIKQFMEELQNGDYFDIQTRAMFIDFTIFSSNFDQFTWVQMIFEQTAGGSVYPTLRQETFPLNIYAVQGWVYKLVGDVIFIVYYFYLIFHMGRDLRRAKIEMGRYSAFFHLYWNIIDLVLFFIMSVVIALTVLYVLDPDVSKFQITTRKYVDLASAGKLYLWGRQINSLGIFIACIKIFQFVGITERFSIINRALYNACIDIFLFLFVIGFVWCGFSVTSYMIFGPQMHSYSTFFGSFMTNFRMCLFDFDYNSMKKVSQVLAPIFLLLYTVIITWTLLNVFIGIVCEKFSEEMDNTRVTTIEELLSGIRFMRRQVTKIRNRFFNNSIQDVDDNMLQDEIAEAANEMGIHLDEAKAKAGMISKDSIKKK